MPASSDRAASAFGGTHESVDRNDVLAAARRIAGRVHRTPVLTSRTLDAELGARLFFKCENLQRMGAFKIRGATNAVRQLPPQVRAVATHSSGNHGAALALAAREAGLDAFIVVPSDARASKRAAIRRYGATVVECEPTLEARAATLEQVVQDTGAAFVPPYDHPYIIAGAGTAALELLEDCGPLDQIWAPVGGGGLAAGTALAADASALCERVGSCFATAGPRVILAEPELARDAKDSLEAGELRPALPPRTVADGLRTGLGTLNFDILQRRGCRVLLASESSIEHWTERTARVMKLVLEPSAATTLASMADNPGVASGRVGEQEVVGVGV